MNVMSLSQYPDISIGTMANRTTNAIATPHFVEGDIFIWLFHDALTKNSCRSKNQHKIEDTKHDNIGQPSAHIVGDQ